MLIVVLTEPLSNSTGQLFVPRKNIVSRNSSQQLGQENFSENTTLETDKTLDSNNINFNPNSASHKNNYSKVVNIPNTSDNSKESKFSIIKHAFLINNISTESSKSKCKNSVVKLNNNNKVGKSKSKENMIYLTSKDCNNKQDSQSSIDKYIKIFKTTLNNSSNSNNIKPIRESNSRRQTFNFTSSKYQKENTSNEYSNFSHNVSKETVLFIKPMPSYIPLTLKKLYKRHNITLQQQRQALEDSTLFSVTEALNNRHLRKHGALAHNDTLDKRPNTRSKKYTSPSKFIEYLPKTPSVFLPAHGVGPLKKRTVVSLLGLFELSTRNGVRPEGKSELAAARLAVKHINKQKLLPGYTLELLTNDTQVRFYFHVLCRVDRVY